MNEFIRKHWLGVILSIACLVGGYFSLHSAARYIWRAVIRGDLMAGGAYFWSVASFVVICGLTGFLCWLSLEGTKR